MENKELQSRMLSSGYTAAPIGQFMTLEEVFGYFEEIKCKPYTGAQHDFTVHRQDVESGGKFDKFGKYTLKRFGNEFACSVYIG